MLVPISLIVPCYSFTSLNFLLKEITYRANHLVLAATYVVFFASVLPCKGGPLGASHYQTPAN
jgi:hypothetical protein